MNENDFRWHLVPGSEKGADAFLKQLDAKCVKINGQRYCVGRVQEGYFAVTDTCPHAGASLGGGWCTKQGEVVCPLHHIRFSMKDGSNTSGEGYRVRTFPVRTADNKLYLGVPKKKWYQFWKKEG